MGVSVSEEQRNSKPTVSRTIAIALPVALLVVAFTALIAGCSGPGSNAAAPAGSAPATSGATGTGLALPPGVDEVFARRIYFQQLESTGNIGKLAEGKIAAISFVSTQTVPQGVIRAVRYTFTDKTTANGAIGLAQQGGNWYFAWMSGSHGATATGGEADTVTSVGHDPFGRHRGLTATNEPTNIPVVNALFKQQTASGDILSSVATGTITQMTVDKVTPGQGTSTIDVILSGPVGTATRGRIVCISKVVGGAKSWFVASFTKS